MYFLCRLIPPRPTFATDMTPAEGEVMQHHVAYWSEQLAKGKLVVFGPVADPAGSWGMAVAAVRDEAEIRALQARDPAIESIHGMRYETLAMPTAIHRGHRPSDVQATAVT